MPMSFNLPPCFAALMLLTLTWRNGVEGFLGRSTPKNRWLPITERPRLSLHPEPFLSVGSPRRRSSGKETFFRLRSQASPSSSSSNALTNDEIARYSRHLVLSNVGMQGQLKLKNASVLVIGAGGLGSPCLLYLAAAGVGHIGIVDGDTVDESNLQRQIIHSCSTVGVSKCQSAEQRIRDINPFVNVRLYEQEFTSQTAMGIVEGGFDEEHAYDIVIDGSDNFPTKYLIKYVRAFW